MKVGGFTAAFSAMIFRKMAVGCQFIPSNWVLGAKQYAEDVSELIFYSKNTRNQVGGKIPK